MTNQRKQIILNEIKFWKQNKLLPEHYCDFLMTLYTEGEHVETEMKGNAKRAIKEKEKRSLRFKYTLLPIVAIVLIASMYMIQSPWLIIIPAVVYSLVCIGAGFYFSKKNGLLAPILQLTGAIVLLFATFNLCMTYYPGNDMALYVVLICNCALWLISGLIMKLTYFATAGGLGLVAIVIYSAM